MTPDIASPAPGSWLVAWDADLYERIANSGGPMSRRRSGTPVGHGARARRRRGALSARAPRRARLRAAQPARRACGISSTPAGSPTSRRRAQALALPDEPCICRPDPAPSPAPVGSLPASDALYQALVLGLCTAWCYDPRRPVLWTRASLTRQLELFDGRGFYA